MPRPKRKRYIAVVYKQIWFHHRAVKWWRLRYFAPVRPLTIADLTIGKLKEIFAEIELHPRRTKFTLTYDRDLIEVHVL